MFAQAYADLRWFATQIAAQFVANGLPTSAAALTYTTLFAVVPLMTVGYVMLSVLPEFSGLGTEIQAFIFKNFVPESSAVIQEKLNEFSAQAQGLTLAGVAFLIGTAFMMLVTMEQTFNRIWQVAQPRRGLARFLVYWAVLTCGPPLLAAGLLISSYLVSLPLLGDMDALGIREKMLRFLPMVLGMTGFTVLYYAMPNTRVPFRHALFGGLLATVMLELAKWGFGAVMSRSSVTLIYGTFAAVPLFLIWVYLVWSLILTGAIVVRTLSLNRSEHESDGEPLLLKAIRVLQRLQKAHLQGEPITDRDLSDVVRMTPEEHARVFQVLEGMSLVGQTDEKEYTLARHLKTVSLWDLYQALPYGLTAESMERFGELGGVGAPLHDFVCLGASRLSGNLENLFEAAPESRGIPAARKETA